MTAAVCCCCFGGACVRACLRGCCLPACLPAFPSHPRVRYETSAKRDKNEFSQWLDKLGTVAHPGTVPMDQRWVCSCVWDASHLRACLRACVFCPGFASRCVARVCGVCVHAAPRMTHACAQRAHLPVVVGVLIRSSPSSSSSSLLLVVAVMLFLAVMFPRM
jgi:hypothetical protein